jgi:hypothetical protein
MGGQLVRESAHGRGTGDAEVQNLCPLPFQLLLLLLLLLLLPTYLAVTRGEEA